MHYSYSVAQHTTKIKINENQIKTSTNTHHNFEHIEENIENLVKQTLQHLFLIVCDQKLVKRNIITAIFLCFHRSEFTI